MLERSRRNDGQLLAHDALIPNSTLLGYLNADHWAVALDIEDESPLLAHRDVDAQFPHFALLQAILHQLESIADYQPPTVDVRPEDRLRPESQ